jgi:CelD/BcsL family acetyltransferase involved in cellulose biosynthesis
MSLSSSFEEIYALKRSGETRRGNRKRDAKLEKSGHVTFGLPVDCEETHKLLELMFQHQASRLAESGIRGVFTSAEREFVHRLADMGEVLLPYHLTINGEMAAMMLGGHYGGTYWALISSLNTGTSRRHSPGDAALRRTIQACCERGLSRFDFSSGDASYKQHWADETLQLHEAIRAVTLKGVPLSGAYLVSAYAKRVIKRSTVLWPLFRSLRTFLRGEYAGAPAHRED